MESLTPQDLLRGSLLLGEIDPDLNRVYQTHGPPPMWGRPQTYTTLVRIILEQQVSLAAAKGTFQRLGSRLSEKITPAGVLSIGFEELRQLGFSRQKARYAIDLAERMTSGTFSLAKLRRLDDNDARGEVMSLLGFGPWSADIYLLMALKRPDILPLGDLGLIKGVQEATGRTFAGPDAIAQYAERWRPWRSVATRMIWQAYLGNRGQDPSRIAAG